MPSTIKIHRVFAAKPEKVFRALVEPDALSKWISPNGFTCTVHHYEAKAGGTYRMSFRNFTTGDSHAFGGEILEFVPGERLVYTDRFEDPNLPGDILVTIELKSCAVSTEFFVVQAGIPDMIPPEACYLGWQESLINLKNLVEPEIPNG